MVRAWSEQDAGRLNAAQELRIAVRRPDGSHRPALPIWVVTIGSQAYVRTWHRRETGWFGHVLRTGRAHVSVPGLETDVVVEDVGAPSGELADEVDAAYAAKYAAHGEESVGGMVSADARASTLRLSPLPRS